MKNVAKTKLSSMTPIQMHCWGVSPIYYNFALLNILLLSKMKNVAKNEIVLHDPYSNALCSFT